MPTGLRPTPYGDIDATRTSIPADACPAGLRFCRKVWASMKRGLGFNLLRQATRSVKILHCVRLRRIFRLILGWFRELANKHFEYPLAFLTSSKMFALFID